MDEHAREQARVSSRKAAGSAGAGPEPPEGRTFRAVHTPTTERRHERAHRIRRIVSRDDRSGGGVGHRSRRARRAARGLEESRTRGFPVGRRPRGASDRGSVCVPHALPMPCLPGGRRGYDAQLTSLAELERKRHSALDLDRWPYERARVVFARDSRVAQAVLAAGRMDAEFRRARLAHATVDGWFAARRALRTRERGFEAAGAVLIARCTRALSRGARSTHRMRTGSPLARPQIDSRRTPPSRLARSSKVTRSPA